MKATIVVLIISLMSVAAFAEKHQDFSGTWVFNPEKSKNIGMMSEMKMTQTIEQSPSSLDVISKTTFQGTNQQSKLHYDLTGKPATNELPMTGPSETVSQWDGDKLVTTWTSKGAVAGTKTVRTEIRSLSSDGKTMTLESVRGSSPAVVMTFEKK